jgi:hypothetical protein
MRVHAVIDRDEFLSIAGAPVGQVASIKRPALLQKRADQRLRDGEFHRQRLQEISDIGQMQSAL